MWTIRSLAKATLWSLVATLTGWCLIWQLSCKSNILVKLGCNCCTTGCTSCDRPTPGLTIALERNLHRAFAPPSETRRHVGHIQGLTGPVQVEPGTQIYTPTPTWAYLWRTNTSWSGTCRQIYILTEARKQARHQNKLAHSNLQTNTHVLTPKLLLFSFDWGWQECREELTTLDEYSFGPKQGQMWNEFFQMWKLVEVLESHVGEDFIVCCLMRVSTSISHYSLSISHFSNCN